MWQNSDRVESMEAAEIPVSAPWKAKRDAFPSVPVIKKNFPVSYFS
jgi:hypothetical protein